MSILSDKILSYSPEVYYKFNDAYSTIPLNSGSVGSTTFTLSNEAPVFVTEGGPLGEGGWNINLGNGTSDTTTTMYRNFQSSSYTPANLPLTDNDYSYGFWFKTNFTLNNSVTHPASILLSQIGGNTLTRFVPIALYGSTANNTNKGKLYFNISGYGSFYSNARVDDQKWHYIAVTATPNGTNASLSVYVDGQLLLGNFTASATTGGLTYTQFGTSTMTGATSDMTTWQISDYYLAPSASIGATQISEIWTVGALTLTSIPLKASAVLVDPVITKYSNKVVRDEVLALNPISFYDFQAAPNFSNFQSPPNLGSSADGGTTWSQNSADSVYPIYNANGGQRGTGSYALTFGGTTDSAPANFKPEGNTGNYNFSMGFWFKTNFTLSNSLVHDTNNYALIRFGETHTGGSVAYIGGGAANAAVKGKLYVTTNGGTAWTSANRYDDQKWHYLYVVTTNNGSTATTLVYVDNVLLDTRTSGMYGGTLSGSNEIGDTSVTTTGTGSLEATTFEFDKFIIGTPTTFTLADAEHINDVATSLVAPLPGIDATHTAEPMYVTTSTLVMPTIIAVIGDHVEITTSILVDAYMADPGFSAGENVTLTSEAILVNALQNDVTLETNRDVIFPTTPATANATIVEALVSRRPMLANASLPMPVIYVSPNYFSLVKNLNPLLYIEDGQQNPVNHGTWNVTSWSDNYFDVNVQSDEQMNAVGNQKSWMANANNVVLYRPEFQANVPNYQTTINDLYATRTLSHEIWYWSKGWGDPIHYLNYDESGTIFNDGITQISEVWDFFGCVPGADPTYSLVLIAEKVKDYNFETEGLNAYAEWRTYVNPPIKREAWNHLVVTYEPLANPSQVRRKVYLNSAIVGNEVLDIANSSLNTESGTNFIDLTLDQPQNIWAGPELGGGIQISGSQAIKLADGVKLDEFAIYPITLSSTQVYEHYNFIMSLSPDAEANATYLSASATMGNHIVIPVMNFEYQESPFSALAARIPEPVIIGGKSKTIVIDAFEGTAILVDPIVAYSVTVTADQLVAYAEEAPAYALNSIYYDYVMANVMPYRYVNFDSADSYLDNGSDEDYAVPAIQIGGTVVNPDEGINGKSIKTPGTSYTSGLILMESEYNDSWGTGQNSYHSSFWMQQAVDDASTTGARVLWNLNGHYDNQHVILYQYQNKLWLNFNNGSGTHIEQSTVSNINLFDYNRHFIVVAFDHSNPNNNMVNLYVDAVLVMSVQLGAYTGQTINSPTYLAPNDVANNFPRLGVGCLITPFADTALSVVPTNIKIYVDEVIWAKSAANQTLVTNLFNTLPGKQNAVFMASIMLASDELVMPTFSTDVNWYAPVLETIAQSGEHEVITEFNNVISVFSADATATLIDTQRSDSVVISSETMLASGSIGGAGTPRVIQATAITANADLQNRKISQVNATNYPIKITVNTSTFSTFEPESAWAKLLRTSTVDTMDLIREVV